jgi:hypothetical protein
MNVLSPDELIELTDYKRPKEQIAWLLKHGWLFEIGGSGRPKVSRAEFERHLVGVDSTKKRPARPRMDLVS